MLELDNKSLIKEMIQWLVRSLHFILWIFLVALNKFHTSIKQENMNLKDKREDLAKDVSIFKTIYEKIQKM